MDTKVVKFARYDQPIDLTGKNLLFLPGGPVSGAENFLGAFKTSNDLVQVLAPVDRITNIRGQIAEEVHFWPNASLGSDFKTLSIHVIDNQIIGLVWSFSLEGFSPLKKQKLSMLGKLINKIKSRF